MDALGAIRVDNPTKLLSDAHYPTDTRPRRNKRRDRNRPRFTAQEGSCDGLRICDVRHTQDQGEMLEMIRS
jgi:hypothetical protein